MKIKNLFVTPKKAVLTCVSAAAMLTALGIGSSFAAFAIAENSAIGNENAQNFALADAGIDRGNVEIIKTDFDYEKGDFVYDIEFVANGNEYEYTIKSSDGTVIKKEIDIISSDGSRVKASAKITSDIALNTALADAGLTGQDVKVVENTLDIEDGISVYEIEFIKDLTKYEYEISAEDGKILESKKEMLEDQTDKQEPTPDGTPANTDNPANTDKVSISLDEAKKLALADAGVTDVKFIKAELDRDGGITVYEIEFISGNTEYEYEINAENGKIVEKKIEKADRDDIEDGGKNDNTQTGSTKITVEKAKKTALAHANLKSSEVSFIKAKLEYDDGKRVYEIEFYCGNMEYEYEIDADTGKILDYSREYDD